MAEGDVTIHLPSLYRAIADRLLPTARDSYGEGWNDGINLVLDMLDGQVPISGRDDADST